MPSVFIKTFGCQMNERDSEAAAAQLVAKGYALAESEFVADVILLNTCSVRDMAEQRAVGKMRTLVGQTRRSRKDVVLGFMGCMAQSRGQQLIDQLPDVDLVVGTQKSHRLAEYLGELLSGTRAKIVDIADEEGSESAIKEHLIAAKSDAKSVTAFVSIMQGCNQRCAFCIVPHARGAERSRGIPEIVAECQQLAQAGAREVTLLGQIVTSFGRRDLPPKGGKSAFVQLLEAVHEVDGLERIRFTSPHPKGYGDDLVEAYGRLPKLCESAHIPVQSGSDRILKKMHRGYTRDRFLEIVEKLRIMRPHIGITTDLIVAFPGETEDDFNETLSLARAARFDNAYIFKYSPRRDTPAADMPGQLADEVKVERHTRLLHIINEVGKQQYEAMIGRRVEVLIEGPSKRNPARLMGRSRCNKIVLTDNATASRGVLAELKIARSGAFTLYGEP